MSLHACEYIEVDALEQARADRAELAILDVREVGEFAAGHIFQASSAPLSVFETSLQALVPRQTTRLVLVDDGTSSRAERAAGLAHELGYGGVLVLRGGCGAWRRAGYELFEGVFVPSKAFGEIVEHSMQVPSISSTELSAWLRDKRDVLILDGRPFDEHRKMCIPGSVCVPNGELAYRAASLLRDDSTPVVVHCAGRTRSIIGTQILREAGLPNPVFALQNGTQGWALSGLELERGSSRNAEHTSPGRSRDQVLEEARAYADRWAVSIIDDATLFRWLDDNERTTYLFDVRTWDEFREGHLQGSVHAPGGQLLQSTDTWIGTRGARVVLIDDAELRAVVIARWLRMMGWEAHALSSPFHWAGQGAPTATARDAQLPPTSPDPASLPVIFDLRSSTEFRNGHIEGARWAIRPNAGPILNSLIRGTRIGLCAPCGSVLELFVKDLHSAGFSDLQWFGDRPEAWVAAGCRLVATPDIPSDADSIDFAFFTHDRHSGNLEASRQYLAWEVGLVDRLSRTDRALFRLAQAG